jgi:hypothetical protein
MSRSIDLNAARRARAAARAEALNEPVVISIGDEQFTLPVELPMDAASALATGSIDAFLVAVLGDGIESFLAQRPSIDDITFVVEGIAAAYGFANPGESQASGS